MTPAFRKLALTVHIIASVGWVGAVAVFLAHAIASTSSQDALLVRAACLAMGLTAWFVILPLSLTSLVTGLVQALGTAWGLFRHYWVLAKLLLTGLATIACLAGCRCSRWSPSSILLLGVMMLGGEHGPGAHMS